MTIHDINDIIKAVCSNSEDYEKPYISPKYLRQELEQLVLEQEQRMLEPTTKNTVDCVSRQFMLNLGATCIATRNENGELIALGAIEELPSVTPQEPGWIHVSERLPEEGQWVMVTFGGKIAVCLAQDNDGTLREATSLILKNATETWLYPESEWGDGYAAWMPLPAPFEPQKSEDKE